MNCLQKKLFLDYQKEYLINKKTCWNFIVDINLNKYKINLIVFTIFANNSFSCCENIFQKN